MTGSRSPAFSPVRRPPRRWWRPLIWLLVLALLAAAAGVVLASAMWGYAWLRLGGEPLAALQEEASVASPTSPPGTTTVLVALTDPAPPQARDEPSLAGGVAVVQVGGPRDGAAVLVLPAGLPIRPERTLGDAQERDGLDGLIRAVVDYTGIRVDHAVRASTDTLPRLVDVRGPVEVCTASGCQELAGDTIRVLLAQADDVERVRAVGAILRSLAEDVEVRDVLLAPRTSKRIIDIVADEVRTDVPLRGTALIDLARTLTDGDQLEVVTVPSLRDPTSGELIVLPERAEVVFQSLRDGTPLVAVDDDVGVAVDQVRVAVLNGAGVSGLAADVRTDLEAGGFTVVGTGNAPPFGHETTTVAYVDGDDAVRVAAILLAEHLGVGRLEAREQAPRFEGEPVEVLVTAGLDLDEE